MFALTLTASVVGFIALAAVLRGLVLSIMWGWFVVPTFGLAPLSIPIAMGLGLILAFTTHQPRYDAEKRGNWADVVGRIIMQPLGTLAIGWLISLFI